MDEWKISIQWHFSSLNLSRLEGSVLFTQLHEPVLGSYRFITWTSKRYKGIKMGDVVWLSIEQLSSKVKQWTRALRPKWVIFYCYIRNMQKKMGVTYVCVNYWYLLLEFLDHVNKQCITAINALFIHSGIMMEHQIYIFISTIPGVSLIFCSADTFGFVWGTFHYFLS